MRTPFTLAGEVLRIIDNGADRGNGFTGETKEQRRTEFLVSTTKGTKTTKKCGRSMGGRRRPAARYENANTSRRRRQCGLYLRVRTSGLSACLARRPSNGRISVRPP